MDVGFTSCDGKSRDGHSRLWIMIRSPPADLTDQQTTPF
jgi:hypothetical protein